MCMGPVGLADTNSTMYFFPDRLSFSPYFSPSASMTATVSANHLPPRRKFIKPGPAISTEVK